MFKVKKNDNCYRCFNESLVTLSAKNDKNRILEIKLCDACFTFFDIISIVKNVTFVHYNKKYLLI